MRLSCVCGIVVSVPAFVLALLVAAPAPVSVESRYGVGLPARPSEPEASRWRERERTLRIQTGVSWGLFGAGLLGTSLLAAAWVSCSNSPECEEATTHFWTTPLFAALAVASLCSASVYTQRLVQHRRARPAVRVEPLPLGLRLRF